MSYDPEEFQRHADDAVRIREVEEGRGRLRTAMFVALLGPLAIGAIVFFKVQLADWMRWGIYGTTPLAAILLIAGYFRMPGSAKFSGKTIILALITLAAAASTLPLVRQFFPQ